MDRNEILLTCKSEVEKCIKILEESKKYNMNKSREGENDLVFYAFTDCMNWIGKGKEITKNHIKYFVKRQFYDIIPNDKKKKMISLISSENGLHTI